MSRAAAAGAAVLAAAIAASPALARSADVLEARAAVSPAGAHLGERMEYRGQLVVPHGVTVRWLPPEPGDGLTWGARRASRSAGPGVDTVRVTIPLQAFRLGVLSLAGLRFEAARAGVRTIHRLPVTNVQVLSSIPDSERDPQLRPPRGPIGAPWWERVPWAWVIAGLVLIAAVVALLARRRRRPTPVPVRAPAAPRRDPATEALAELAALRRLALPAGGRHADHALRLTRILRRFLEATAITPRPGDTSATLARRLPDTWVGGEDAARVEGLLTRWDRVKFARVSSTADEAARAEDAVEALIRSWPGLAGGRAA